MGDQNIDVVVAECRRFNRVGALSRTDAKAYERDYGLADVADVPTAVDVDYFRPAGRAVLELHNLVFTGSMDWLHEDGITWFVEAVLARIHARVPDVTLTIVGRDPPPRIRQLAAQDSRLRVTGSVPDVRPFIEAAVDFVVPLRVGGGTRLKIFEALAMERSPVSTTIGAEGLPLEDRVHAVIADGETEFADAVLELLEDRPPAAALAERAAAWVRSHFGWCYAAESFVELLAAIDTESPRGFVRDSTSPVIS